jgi:GMP synthase-like glutamine amidotransferase
MILIIQIQSMPFHFFEFVKPIEEVVRSSGESFSSVHYMKLSDHDIEKAEKIIIAGTSLKDISYLKDLERFTWINETETPILGICGGMQILASCFEEQIKNGKEIGLHTIRFPQQFLGVKDHVEVYELHNKYVEPSVFDVIASSAVYPQVIAHPQKPFYGVLFHPEVRNKSMITWFISD